jgi:hypothetical protein
MIIHRILEIISIKIPELERKKNAIYNVQEILKNKNQTPDVFFDIFKYIGYDIKTLYNTLAPYLFMEIEDHQCCSLIWKVDKYIDIDGNPIIVPSRCTRNRVDRTTLYCKTHNNPKLNDYCKSCLKDINEYIYHEKNWEHFGNIFQFHLNPCFNSKNINSCYKQQYGKNIDDIRCISYAEFFIEKNKDKWFTYFKNDSLHQIELNNLKYETLQKVDDAIKIEKNTKIKSNLCESIVKNQTFSSDNIDFNNFKKNTDELANNYKTVKINPPVYENIIKQIKLDTYNTIDYELTSNIKKDIWCLILQYIFSQKHKIKNELSSIIIFDKEDEYYTDGTFIYDSKLKMDGLILNNDIAIFKDEIDKYIKTLNIQQFDENILKLFIKEVL